MFGVCSSEMKGQTIRGWPNHVYIRSHCDYRLWKQVKAEAALDDTVVPAMLNRIFRYYFEHTGRMPPMQELDEEDS